MVTIAVSQIYFFFFFNDTATTEIYTLSLHDALPICPNFVPFVVSALAASGLSPDRLELEITETVLMQSNEVVLKTLYQLRRSEEHTSELQSRQYLVCRLLLEKKKKTYILNVLFIYNY